MCCSLVLVVRIRYQNHLRPSSFPTTQYHSLQGAYPWVLLCGIWKSIWSLHMRSEAVEGARRKGLGTHVWSGREERRRRVLIKPSIGVLLSCHPHCASAFYQKCTLRTLMSLLFRLCVAYKVRKWTPEMLMNCCVLGSRTVLVRVWRLPKVPAAKSMWTSALCLSI
jgi:hypothetical protein